MLQKSLKDDVIVNYMLSQPFSVPYARNDITQLAAVLSFDESGIPSFYLSEEIQQQLTYPDPSDILIL